MNSNIERNLQRRTESFAIESISRVEVEQASRPMLRVSIPSLKSHGRNHSRMVITVNLLDQI